MIKFFDWLLILAAVLVLSFVLAAAISDSWGNELKKTNGWQKNNIIEVPK